MKLAHITHSLPQTMMEYYVLTVMFDVRREKEGVEIDREHLVPRFIWCMKAFMWRFYLRDSIVLKKNHRQFATVRIKLFSNQPVIA